MEIIHDGQAFRIDENCWGEFLNTRGRLGWRLTDRLGRGILIEKDGMVNLMRLLEISLQDINDNEGAPGHREEL